MAVALSIKDVPDHIARALKALAARNHRSIQGELMHILVEAVEEKAFDARGLVKRLQRLGPGAPTPTGTEIVRRDRDSR